MRSNFNLALTNKGIFIIIKKNFILKFKSEITYIKNIRDFFVSYGLYYTVWFVLNIIWIESLQNNIIKRCKLSHSYRGNVKAKPQVSAIKTKIKI